MVEIKFVDRDITVVSPDGIESIINEIEFALLRADIAKAHEVGWQVKFEDRYLEILPSGRMNDWSWFESEHRIESALMRLL